jgi:isopenicillin-N N-acyltransferase-like protein
VACVRRVRTFTSSVLGPEERGAEFGRVHRDEVARTVSAYRRLFLARALGRFDVDAWSELAWQRIRQLAPEAAAEIRGIADGAGLPVSHVAGVNARTELLAIANPTGVDECSTVVSLPPKSPPVAVQTWDWYDAMADLWLHWTIPHPDGRVVETVTEYGILGKIGVNRSGVGVLFNMLHHAADRSAGERGIGCPVHLLSRRILDEAEDLGHAQKIAYAAPTSASTSLTLVQGGSSQGDAVSVELFPGGPGSVAPTEGLLVRTNHFVSEEGAEGCLADTTGPGSRIRRQTLVTAFGDRLPQTVADVVTAMHDHREVGGVCAHPDRSAEPLLRHKTLATVSVDTAHGRLAVAAGGPCGR